MTVAVGVGVEVGVEVVVEVGVEVGAAVGVGVVVGPDVDDGAWAEVDVAAWTLAEPLPQPVIRAVEKITAIRRKGNARSRFMEPKLYGSGSASHIGKDLTYPKN